MFYLMTHSTHFISGYMASDICLTTILIVRKETHCCHIGYSYRLTARVLLYAPSHRQDNTYHSLCYTSRGALAGTRNSSMGPPHEGSIRRPYLWATSHSHVFDEGRNILFNDGQMVKNDRDNERETCCCHYTGYSFKLAERDILYAHKIAPFVQHWLAWEIARWVN